MSFMMQIDAAARTPLDQFMIDYLLLRGGPTIEFCRRAVGIGESDQHVARRLGVAISTVRGWRDIGRRAAAS